MKTSDLECVTTADRMAVLLDPLRLQILERAQQPASATAIAAELGLPRQKVSYHVRELHRCRFLRRAGTRKKRNMVEQRYVASARSYALSPAVLGALQGDDRRVTDALSASRLLALGSRLIAELGHVMAEATAADARVATLSIATDVRFASAAERARFAEALRDAVADTVARFSSPAPADDPRTPAGRPFRLVVGCYPAPRVDAARRPLEDKES